MAQNNPNQNKPAGGTRSEASQSGNKSATSSVGVSAKDKETLKNAGDAIREGDFQQVIENKDELIEIGRDFIGKLSSYVEREAKKRPVAILGGALSLGYLFGQGWLRAATKIGMAYVATEAARRAMPSKGRSSNQNVIH